MKAFFTLLFCSSFFLGNAQLSILFVDDSNDDFDNSIVFRDAVTQNGYGSTLYNVPDSNSGPSVQYLFNFDLVIWHTSSIGSDLELWDGTGEDNENIKGYLDGGGMLWLVGLDFLFDRYGVPPVSFQDGDFVYDYLGLASYDVQSYGDDGGLGVPELYPDTDSPILGLDPLSWIFDTSWWIDGVTPVENAGVVYRMGDDSYVLADTPCAIYHENDDYKVLTYLFDLAQVENGQMLNETVLDVLFYFDDFVDGVAELNPPISDLTIYPNPAVSELTVTFSLNESSNVSAEIVDLQGKLVVPVKGKNTLSEGLNRMQMAIPEYVPAGMYFLKINAGSKSVYKKLVISGF